jgi:predicted nuclease of predicted toxin-antitoxin system
VELIADESVDRPIVDALRRLGYLVWYVAELDPGISDSAVLDLANQKRAVLLTADKDFGELVYRRGRSNPGILLVRLAGLPPERKANIVCSVVRTHGVELRHAVAVVTERNVRVRKPRG